jgi:UDP-N-acetylglucosamine 2-epimerase
LKRLKIVTFVGTRPEIIRLSRLIPLLDKRAEHTLVHTGQNSDPNLSDVFFSGLEIRDPDEYLGISNETPARAMAETLMGAESVLKKVMPDAVVVLGDTNSAVAAIAARRMGIAVYHLEAGNRSFDENVPEEINRRMVDHVSTFNLPYSETARRNLLAEGFSPRYICITGSPISEVISHYDERITSSEILTQLELRAKSYFVASAHRQENVDDPIRLSRFIRALNDICMRYKQKIVFPVHPRTRQKLVAVKVKLDPMILLTDPLSYFDYLTLQKNASCVLSDSGTISEESAILNFPSVTIRDSMERQEMLEAGGISMAGLQSEEIMRAIDFQLSGDPSYLVPEEYTSKNFSQRVYMFIESTAPRVSEWQGIRKY